METEFAKQFRGAHPDEESDLQRARASFTAQFGEDDSNTLLNAFVEAMVHLLAQVDTHVQQRDGVLLKRLTHRVIGMCPIYSATQTADVAQSIEDELQLEDWSKVEELCCQLRISFQKYLGR